MRRVLDDLDFTQEPDPPGASGLDLAFDELPEPSEPTPARGLALGGAPERLPDPADLATAARGGGWSIDPVRPGGGRFNPLAWPSVPAPLRLALEPWISRIPEPPLIDPSQPTPARVALLRLWYDGACVARAGVRHYRAWPKGAVLPAGSPLFNLLAVASDLFHTHGIRPPVWLAFSVDQWLRSTGGQANPAPAPEWAFHSDRIVRFRGLARRESSGVAGRLVYTPSARAFLAAQERLTARLLALQPQTDAAAAAIVAATFPPGERSRLLEHARIEAMHYNDDALHRVKTGGWLW